MTTKYNTQKNKLIVVLVLTLFIFLSSVASYIYQTEKDNRYGIENNKINIEIELLADFIGDFINNDNYYEVKNILAKWVAKKDEVVDIQVTMSNGNVIFSAQKECNTYIKIEKKFILNDNNITILLSHNIIQTKKYIEDLAIFLIITVHLLTIFIGLILWFILSRWILKPLKIEIKHKTVRIKKYSDDLKRVNRSHMALSRSNMALLTSKNTEELFDNICHTIHNLCQYKLVWIGKALHDKEKNVKVVAKDGFDNKYTSTLDISWDEHSKRGQGPTGRSIREKKAIIVNDTQNDIFFTPWKETAKINGFLSSAAFPIIIEGSVYGTINIYSGFENAFIKDEIKLLTELSNNLAYGIVALKDRNEVKYLSITDKLTGLFNRLKIDESLKSEIQRAKRYKSNLSIIMLDIDYFKKVNDKFGHQVGDKVLQEFSNILKSTCRDTDLVGRWGGEEFIVICVNSDKKETIELAQRIRQIIEKFSFDTVGHKTVSLGVCVFKDTDTVNTLTKRADDALYHAKNSNRNCVKFCDK